MGFGIKAEDSANLTADQQEKLAASLKRAAEDYQAGRFDRAVNAYEQAALLDGNREDLRQAVETARKMGEAQREALHRLPTDPRDQQRLFEVAYQASLQHQGKNNYQQAYNGLYQLWLTAGDYNGKTVAMLDRLDRQTQQQTRMAPDYQVASLASDTLDRSPVLPPTLEDAVMPADGIPVSTPSERRLHAELVSAQAAIQTGHLQDARRILEDILNSDPLNQDARRHLAWLDRVEIGQDAMENSGAQVEIRPLDEISQVAGRSDKAPVMVAQVPDDSSVVGSMAENGTTAIDDVTRLKVNYMLHQVEQHLDAGRLDQAQSMLNEALGIWPTNEQAARLKDRLDKQMNATSAAMQPAATASMAPAAMGAAEGTALGGPELFKQIDGMHRQASRDYHNGRLAEARALWSRILQLDPENRLAKTWIENTEAAYQEVLKQQTADKESAQMKESARQLLDAPISITTDREISLTDFMHLLSFATPVELQYYIAEGARAPIFGSFRDQPLRKVLDTVLEPAGLTWSINENNIITITQKLTIATFPLTPSQISQVRILLDSGQFQRLIWNQTEPPAEGVDITLDERVNMLMVTGSRLHIERVRNLLPSLQVATETDLVTRFYKIREADGPRIRALINSIIESKEDTIFGIERKIYIDGDDLIIRDTPENIKQIEDLLLDRGFIQMLTNEQIGIQAFSLVPKNVEAIKTDEVQVFTSRVVEAIKVFLYAQEGESRAAEEGRRLWFDEASLQLTIVDTPSNLQRVSEYINSLPQISEKSQQKVVRLRHAVAEELSASLLRILDLTDSGAGGAGGATGGESTVLRLRRGQERTFRNARIRLVRVDEGDVSDRNDDSAELSINTGVQINQTTVRELETQYVDDFEITAEDVLPSSGQPGDGTASIMIRYVPRIFAQQQQAVEQQLQTVQAAAQFGGPGAAAPTQLAPQQPAGGQTALEEQGITITPFGELNVLIIRYTNPLLFQEAIDLIEQLDQPIRQVEIETKFVEVNETRAKEIGGSLEIAGFGRGRDLDWTTQVINGRFAQETDELRSQFDTPLTNPFGPNFLQGTTVINAVIGNFPSVEYSLRMLEAQGVVNVVNGPKVTAIDGIEAEFRIETYITQGEEPADTTFAEIFNPIDTSTAQLADFDEATQNADLVGGVVLRVTPEITSADSILLRDLSAELIDFDRYLNQISRLTPQDLAGVTDQSTFVPVFGAQTINAVNLTPLLKRKKIVTDARIRNGGTIVIGGWTGERSEQRQSGIPVLQNMPYLGKILFSRQQWTRDRTTLLIFLTGNLVD
jgi:type II secretory pathway component GspD/PulD (secretin)